MKRLDQKVVLITGGTQSIGKAIAELFNNEGAKVIITGRRPLAAGSKIAKQLGDSVTYLELDVSSEAAWQTAMRLIANDFGKLDVLINNAGIEYPSQYTLPQNPEYCPLADWLAVHNTNLVGVFLGCKFAIAMMKKNQHCSIVNIGSRSGLVGVPSSAAYSSSKAAVANYTKTVALYCAANNYSIRCNVIHPAAILTNMWDKELGVDDMRSKRAAEFSKNIPLKRMGDPMDVAYAALYFASQESKFVTGAELLIDGGIMAGSAASAMEEVMELA